MEDTRDRIGNPNWVGPRVELRPVRQSDYEFLYALCHEPDIAVRWRYRGAIPLVSDFAASMTAGVLVQFMVLSRRNHEPLGLVTAYNANHREGWVYVAGLATSEASGSGRILEGIGLLLGYLFHTWPLRKVYFETMEFNLQQFGSLPPDLFHEESRLRAHVYYGGRYWDDLTLAVYSDQWQASEWVRRNLSHIGPAAIPDVLDIDAFCDLVIRQVSGMNEQSTSVDPNRTLESLGFDSLSMLELATLIDELTGADELDWSASVDTLVDAYSWYCTAASWPIRNSDQPDGQVGPNDETSSSTVR